MQVFGINPRHVGLLYFTHCVVLKPSPDEASALEVLPNYLRVKTADAELIDRNATKRPNYVATSADSKIRYYYFSPVNTPPIDWLKV